MEITKTAWKKSISIISLILVSIIANPFYLQAQGNPGGEEGDELEDPEDVEALTGALGQIFGLFREFGANGELLGQVFQLMLTNFVNMSNTQELDGIYVLNASVIQSETSGSYTYGNNQRREYNPWGVYNLEDADNPDYQDEYPYFVLEQNGTVEYNKTEGVSITFIIWDENGSFINTLDRLISTVKEFQEIQAEVDANPGNDEVQQKALSKAAQAAISAATYFIMHINDIITGDEVIIANTIAFSNYEADFDGTIEGTWYVTEDGVRTDTVLLADVLPTYESDYMGIANYYNDEYMRYILLKEYLTKKTQNYTQFSFDIIELWLKEFKVSIDAEAILGALAQEEDAFGGKTATDIFQELKLEFYIFTHHFSNWVLFNDHKFNASSEAYANGVPDVLFEEVGTYEGEPVEKITDTEVVDYILFRGAEEWSFKEPEYHPEDNSMDWGVRADNLDFRIIPIGLKDGEINDTEAPIETMEYMELGFSFEPTKNYDVDTGAYFNAQGTQTMGSAKVKLVQSFGAWNLDTDDKPFTPHLKNQELQLATIFMSTIFHFKLEIDNREIVSGGETPSQALLNASNYDSETSKVNVGDIDQELPLAEIDIAGPEYEQYDKDGVMTTHPARTTTIPTVYIEYEGQSSETYEQEDESVGQLNSTVNFDFSVLIYAVAYDTFGYDGWTSGDEIVHDPTFSIYIIADNPGFWAVILVVGSIALVGIAALIITKRKQSSAGF